MVEDIIYKSGFCSIAADAEGPESKIEVVW
jgi:hypothetical protein